MNKIKAIKNSFLFRHIDEEEIVRLTDSISLCEQYFSKGDVIISPQDFEKKLGILTDGECTVERVNPSGDRIPLNTVLPGDSFGILAVFTGRDEFPTYVVAKKQTTVVFIQKNELEQMMRSSHRITMNIIDFLANRIDFLCDKISSFSSDNIEQRLAMYLLKLYKNNDSQALKFNKKRAAEELNTGRTSLYRAIDSLEQMGLIKTNEKTIIIIDHEGLERISK